MFLVELFNLATSSKLLGKLLLSCCLVSSFLSWESSKEKKRRTMGKLLYRLGLFILFCFAVNFAFNLIPHPFSFLTFMYR